MVSEICSTNQKKRRNSVLILVLVEDGLRVEEAKEERSKLALVLILVLVEDGLRVYMGVMIATLVTS